METGSPLADRIIGAFDGMSRQLQVAARYVLDNPSDVALLTMREQARRAGVQPATMTRLAQHLGLDGYEEVRRQHAEAIRADGPGLAGRAGAQARNQKLVGDQALAAGIVAAVSQRIATLADPQTLTALVEAAERLDRARRIYCLGLRSSHPVVWHLHYILSMIGERSTLLDWTAGVGADPIGAATPADLLVAASVRPYTRLTVEIAGYAHANGVPVVAITDSVVSPLAQLAATTIVVPTEGPSFLHTMSPAFAVAELLGALVAGKGGETALQSLARLDRQLAALHTHLEPAPAKRKQP